MENVSEKKNYVKPAMTECGSLVEQTLTPVCPDRRLVSGTYWCLDED